MFSKLMWLSAVTVTIALATNLAQAFSCADTETTGVPQIECEALVALYDSTNGAGWLDHTNWKTTAPVSRWKGVDISNGRVSDIRLDNNQLSGTIPTELGNLTALRFLYLNNNQLSGPIPAELGNLTALSGLFLYRNQLNGSIPTELGNLVALQVLKLTFNQLSGPIPPELGNLTELVVLEFNKNQLSGRIPAELANLSKLKGLWLGENQFSGTLPVALTEMPELKRLDVEYNQLSGAVPPELANMAKLEFLFLSGNNFDVPLPDVLGNIPNLTYLKLESMALTTVPSWIANLSQLNQLSLEKNQLSTLPDWLGEFTNMYKLYLGENQFSTLPTWFGNLTFLNTLTLNDNQFSGTIPVQLANFRRLNVLNLSNNELSGNIPTWFGNLTKLGWLDLSNNQFTGLIPTEMSAITRLFSLHMSHNYLSGDSPSAELITVFSRATNLTIDHNCLNPTDPTIRRLLDTNAPGWDTEQTHCTPPVSSTPIANDSAHLVNISTRAFTGRNASNIVGGFVIQGNGGCNLMIRGFGRGMGMSPDLDTQLTLYTFPDGQVIKTNSGWETGNIVTSIPTALRLPDPSDAGIYTYLSAGAYTVGMGPQGTTGTGMVGVDAISCDAGTELINISTRAEVRTGQDAVIAGFIIQGEGTLKLMIRGFGRGLGFDDCLDTEVELYRVQPQPNVLLDRNDDWQTAANAAQVPTNAQLPHFTDAGMLVELAAGAYTAIMTPKAGSCQGIGLIGVDVIQ